MSGLAGEYTVNGDRCLRGGCRLNVDVKYWFCEVEGGAGWDYCCRPEHRCGYSEGYQYPWCFVGEAGYDQWRPCDEDRARIGDRYIMETTDTRLSSFYLPLMPFTYLSILSSALFKYSLLRNILEWSEFDRNPW